MSILHLPQVGRAFQRRWAVPQATTRLAAFALIAVAAFWHLAYLIYDCPLDLSADEAHYWDWSRHLDWSYYSQGPLVAWIIRLSCEIFGGLSVRLVGTEMLAVRLPAILCGVALLSGIFTLASRVLNSERLALATVAVALTVPVLNVGATLMTIDAPYTCAWVWALVFAHSAIFRDSRWGWALTGVAIAIGILAKYTMAVWLPCVGMFLLCTPTVRGELRRPGFWIACGIAATSLIPIVIWNMQHDWVSFRHVGWQAGTQATEVRWFGPVRYITEQAGLMLIFWFICWAMGMWRHRPGRAANPQLLFMWWTSVPMFALFLVVTFKTPGQMNWPIAAYVSGLIIAVEWLAYRFATVGPRWYFTHSFFLAVATLIGFALTIMVHYPAAARPILNAVSAPPTAANPMPIRKLDPSARLRGWRELAAAIDDLRGQLEASGDDPIIITTFWTLPGEIAFYTAGHPEVYCAGPAFGQRRSQYDVWRPNPLWDPAAYRGRTVIFVGDFAPELVQYFDSVGTTQRVERVEAGQTIAYWHVTVCRGYRGFGGPESWGNGKAHF
jgi:4-amino-4-deoxy-L-arabinose transferase-like glycosyltransferase